MNSACQLDANKDGKVTNTSAEMRDQGGARKGEAAGTFTQAVMWRHDTFWILLCSAILGPPKSLGSKARFEELVTIPLHYWTYFKVCCSDKDGSQVLLACSLLLWPKAPWGEKGLFCCTLWDHSPSWMEVRTETWSRSQGRRLFPVVSCISSCSANSIAQS